MAAPVRGGFRSGEQTGERISFGGGPPSEAGPDRRRRGPPRKLLLLTDRVLPIVRRSKRAVMSDRLLDANEVAELLQSGELVRETTRSGAGAMPHVELGGTGGIAETTPRSG